MFYGLYREGFVIIISIEYASWQAETRSVTELDDLLLVNGVATDIDG